MHKYIAIFFERDQIFNKGREEFKSAALWSKFFSHLTTELSFQIFETILQEWT